MIKTAKHIRKTKENHEKHSQKNLTKTKKSRKTTNTIAEKHFWNTIKVHTKKSKRIRKQGMKTKIKIAENNGNTFFQTQKNLEKHKTYQENNYELLLLGKTH